MKILEVREGFIKFESGKQISLSSFIQVNGVEKRYIAQVVQVKRSGESQIAYAKILFLYDGALQPYDRTLPTKDSEIIEFTFDIINKSLDSTQPIVVGKFIDNDINIPMDKTCFDKKMLISSDSSHSLTTILTNLQNQFLNLSNIVLIDMLGNLEFSGKTIAGQDFRLPLNTESLEFMYEDCLNDATSDSKVLIKEIFQDLSEYSKTVSFLPFKALKTIVDDMVDKSHIFKLLVLKNKLAKFDKQGYFAGNISESENLEKILNQKLAVIDLSKLDTIFQNRYLEVICSILEKQGGATQIFVNASNAINKRNLKNIITNERLSTVFVTHSKFKYINEIKTMFDNFIIEPSFVNNEIFKVYSTFLNSMPKETALIVGEGTNYIPLVSPIKLFEVQQIQSPVENETIEKSKEVCIEEITTIGDENTQVENIEAMENDSIEEVSAIETIDKKSEELIERISEEVEITKPTFNSIFTADEQEDEIEVSGVTAEDLDVVSEDENVNSLQVEDLEQAEFQNQEKEEHLIKESVQVEDSSINSSEDIDVISDDEIVEDESSDVDSEFLIEDTSEEDFEIVESTTSVNLENIADDNESFETSIVEDEILTNDVEPESLRSDNIVEEDSILEHDEAEIIEVSDELSMLTEDVTTEDSLVIEESISSSDKIEFADTALVEENTNVGFDEPELEVLPITDSTDSMEDFGEIVELDESELQEGDIIVELEDEESLSGEEILDKEIVEDVDKVFTTMKEDSISDSDLDFIDELNEESIAEEAFELDEIHSNDEIQPLEELPEFAPDEDSDDSFLEPLQEINVSNSVDDDKEILETRNASTPMVPLYEAEIPQEDIVTSDLIDQGDSVTHAKYGHGVVEKMIKYGTKTLYSINFDNIGRRLLDPTLTEIKKA